MPTFILKLLDGQSLSVVNEAPTLAKFLRHLEERKFVTSGNDPDQTGVATRAIATVKVQPEASETTGRRPRSTAQHDPLGRVRK